MKCFDNKSTGILNAMDLKRPKYKLGYCLMFAFLAILAAICLIPSIWVLMSSLKSSQEIYAIPPTFFPKQLSMETLMEAWEDLDFGKNFIATIVLSLLEIFFSLSVSGLGGFVLSRLKPTGAKLIFAVVTWTMMMPGQMRTVPLFMTFMDFPGLHVSLMDTYIPMCLIAAANSYFVLLFKTNFDSISNSYIEAAQIDGASPLYIFFKIMLPLSKPIMIFVAISVFQSSWGDFFWPMLVLNESAMQPIPVRLYYFRTATDVKMNAYFLGLTVASIPPFIFFAIFQKQIMGGINIGGVKG